MKRIILATAIAASVVSPSYAKWWNDSIYGGCQDDGGEYEWTPAGMLKEVAKYEPTARIVDHGSEVDVFVTVNGTNVVRQDLYRTKAACEAVDAALRANAQRAIDEEYRRGRSPSSEEEVEKNYGLDAH